MPLYSYRCEKCDRAADRIVSVVHRNDPQSCEVKRCDGWMLRDKAAEGAPPVHFHGAGFTRQPSIMRDKIADGHPGRDRNWGTTSKSDLGDPGSNE